MNPVVLIFIALVGAAAGIGAVASLDDVKRRGSPEPAKMPGLVYDDSFSGTSLDTGKWAPYHSPGNADIGLRRPSAFSLDGNGALVVTALRASRDARELYHAPDSDIFFVRGRA
jgi:hypothetical protein